MFFIRLTIYKSKADVESAVEIPAFFRYEETFEEVMTYLNSHFNNIATLYVEYLDNPEDDQT